MSSRMLVTSGEMRMKTSRDGFVFGIRALRYALPMSTLATSLFSAAAICEMRNMEVVDMVGEDVSALGTPINIHIALHETTIHSSV